MKTFAIFLCMFLLFGTLSAAEATTIPYDPVPGFNNRIGLTRDDLYKTTFTPESDTLITVEIEVELYSGGTWENIEDELIWRFYAATPWPSLMQGLSMIF
jgi:hypothetical protein